MKNKLFRRPTALSPEGHLSILSRGAHLSPEGHLSGRAAALSALLLLLGRGLGGGLLLLIAAPALAQTPNLTVCANQGFSLVSTEDADGVKPITYTWYENNQAMGSHTASICIAEGRPVGTYAYVRKASNAVCEEVASNSYTVQVLPIPSITTQPAVRNVICAGSSVTLRIEASNVTAYQWKKNGNNVTDGTGGNTANYTTATLTENATYTVALTGVLPGCTVVTSNEAPVTVLTPPTTAYTSSCNATGTITWSDRIVATPSACTLVTNLSNLATPPAQYMKSDGRVYYNKTCVLNTHNTLCPSPWRVPNTTELFHMMGEMNGDDRSALHAIWGYGGYAEGSSFNNVDTGHYFVYEYSNWSNISIFGIVGTIMYTHPMYEGDAKIGRAAQVRCVQVHP